MAEFVIKIYTLDPEDDGFEEAGEHVEWSLYRNGTLIELSGSTHIDEVASTIHSEVQECLSL